MIFSLPVQYRTPDGRVVEAIVDYHVNEAAIASVLGPQAAENRSGRSVALYGAITAEVRPGSLKEVLTRPTE